MNNLVSSENIDKILFGITDKILLDINNKDITEDQKTILTKVNNLISNGNGLKILTDNGKYKECNPEELKTAINNTDNVFDLFNISVSEEKWEDKANMLTPRTFTVCNIYNDKIYCIGGYGSDKNECYDITTNTWSTKANMITARGYHTASIYNDKIYCIGGYISNINECYDISTDTWSSKTSMIGSRYRLGSCVYNDKIYCIGGYGNGDGQKNEYYDIATNTWTSKMDTITKMYAIACCCIGDTIFCVGSNTIAFDINTNTWSSRTVQEFKPIDTVSAVNYNNYIYTFIGSGVDAKVQCYDTSTDSWVIRMKNTKMTEGKVCLFNNHIYYLGGNNNNWVGKYTIPIETYDLILPDNIQNKLDVIKQNGIGTKILADNGIYIEIPKGYRYMNEGEINNLITNLSNKINGGE